MGGDTWLSPPDDTARAVSDTTAVAIARLEEKVDDLVRLIKGNGGPGLAQRLIRVELGLARKMGWLAGFSLTIGLTVSFLVGWLRHKLGGPP